MKAAQRLAAMFAHQTYEALKDVFIGLKHSKFAMIINIAYAQTITSLLGGAQTVVERITSFLFVVATAVFLWGIITYVIAGGDEKKLDQAKNYIIYGLIGLFVMVAVWGIVNAICLSLFGSSRGC